MANVDPPAISTPSRPRYSLNPKRSSTFDNAATAPNVAGFSPGGQVFEGYSYLSRSTSMSTSTRSRPKGLQSRTSDVAISPVAAAPRNLPTSPSSQHIPSVTDSPTPSPLTNASDLPQRSKTIHRMLSSISTPNFHSIDHPPRSTSESERLAEAVANLPHNPKTWLPSQVALYLTHVLGLVPRPVVEDVTAYVRSSRMGGRAFLRLSEKDLERQGLNLKWRKLMIEAVRKLRRDALRGRIWGYESGSLRWPKSAKDMEREEAEDEEDGDAEQSGDKDGVVHHSKTTSKLTLKRMRDSRKVRGMIQAFQTSPEKEPLPLSNLSIDSGYGQGYVRGQAQQLLSEAEEKRLSLRRPLRPRRSTADLPWLQTVIPTKHQDIEALLASLSQQEAQDLADQLGITDLQDTEAVSQALQDSPRREPSSESADELVLMPTLTRHNSVDTTEGETSLSECSGTESEADFSPDEPRYGVLDEDVIRAILADQEAPQLTRSHTTSSIVRPSRPYRASLYTEDELAALDTDVLHMRTESSRELVEAMVSAGEVVDDVQPDFGTARLRCAEGKDILPIPNFDECSSPTPAVQTDSTPTDEYIFTLPDPPPPPTTTRLTGSIRTASRKATFGSKRGKAVLSLLNGSENNAFASLPGASMLRETRATAEDKEGWGGTMGRSGSSNRKGLNGVFESVKPFRKRVLERVASEAEGEMGEVERVVERYDETVLRMDALERRASDEERLGSLFQGGAAEGMEGEVVAVVDTATAAPEERDEMKDKAEAEAEVKDDGKNEAEAVASDQAEVVPTATVEEAVELVSEPLVDDEVAAVAEPAVSSTAEADTVAEPAVEPEPVVESDAPTTDASSDSPADHPSETDVQPAIPIQTESHAPTCLEANTEEPFEHVPSAKPQLLVPLTTLEPHPSGTGSIKKRSMVLVDRKRFESLARRMTDIESQLSMELVGSVKGRSGGLRAMFDAESQAEDEEEAKVLDDILAASSLPNPPETMGKFEVQDAPSTDSSAKGWRSLLNPSSWASYLSSLNPYYSITPPPPTTEPEDELDLYALLGQPESDQERHLLRIGAIPAYMLGLGAGVGFVLVREVLGSRH